MRTPQSLLELADEFEELAGQPLGGDPLAWPGYPAALAAARERTGHGAGVTAGIASFRGAPCVLVAFDFAFLGGSLGEAEGQRVVGGIERARAEGLPLVSLVTSGGVRMQEGVRALTQMRRIAEALVRLRRAGLPHISVALHPTTGGVWSSLTAAADYVVAERGAQVCFSGARVRRHGAGDDSAFRAEERHGQGFADRLTTRTELAAELGALLRLLSPAYRGPATSPDVVTAVIDEPPGTGMAQVLRARAPGRTRAMAYLDRYFDWRVDIHGDRVGGNDDSVSCGFGRRRDRTVAYAAQCGRPTTAAGFRTVARLVRTADALGLPVLTLIDSPGPANEAEAEESGVGTALAELLRQMAELRVPVRSVVIGEGGSGAAMALASDDLWMAADAYLTVIAPESATAILKRPATHLPEVARTLRLGPADMVALGVARGCLPPCAGAAGPPGNGTVAPGGARS